MQPHINFVVFDDFIAEGKTVVGGDWMGLILALGANMRTRHD